LRAKAYQYWALGHIHQPEILCEEPWITFAGNCQGRHANEAGARGCRLVSVDEEHQISAVEWRTLDVVRWAQVRVDATGLTDAAALLRACSAALEQAVCEAEGRLVAARVVFFGATALHGALHQQREHWLAEVLGCAQALGDAAVWVERLRVETLPVYDLAALAERDALTRIVIESLEAEGTLSAAMPEAIADMLAVFPASAVGLRQEAEAELADENRPALLNEVRAIILEALSTRGGSST
jgi:DNA repair exonuclease SbcCD nuclease subunit